MALSLDGSVNSNTTVGSTVTATLSTTLTNDIIVVAVKSSTNNVVTGVSDGAGLTWAKRKAVATTNTEVELWWALSAGVLTSDVITVTFTGAPTSGRVIAFGVNGANTTTPFDVNVSLPAGSTINGTSISQTISTTNANTFIIAWVNPGSGSGALTKPSGFTNLFQASTFYSLDYEIVSSAQSSLAVGYSAGTQNWAEIVDAVQAATPRPGFRSILGFWMGGLSAFIGSAARTTGYASTD